MVKWRSAITKRFSPFLSFWINFSRSYWHDQPISWVLADKCNDRAIFLDRPRHPQRSAVNTHFTLFFCSISFTVSNCFISRSAEIILFISMILGQSEPQGPGIVNQWEYNVFASMSSVMGKSPSLTFIPGNFQRNKQSMQRNFRSRMIAKRKWLADICHPWRLYT
jgi:hypothetical protein